MYGPEGAYTLTVYGYPLYVLSPSGGVQGSP